MSESNKLPEDWFKGKIKNGFLKMVMEMYRNIRQIQISLYHMQGQKKQRLLR